MVDESRVRIHPFIFFIFNWVALVKNAFGLTNATTYLHSISVRI